MKRFTETTELSFNDLRDSRAVIVEGDVLLHSWNGIEFIAGEALTAGSYEVFTKGLRIKFELVSGSGFAVDTGENK